MQSLDTSTLAIIAQGLTRRFGKFTAVDHISFEIPYGTIFGYLGANGAGKSTTIKMLCGILAPSEGSGSVAGFDVRTQPEQIKQSIGYVSQKFSLYGDLTVVENLLFYGRIYGLDGHGLQERIEEVLALTGLKKYETQQAQFLSGGWKQKLAIANGILHQPKILFLDEPTAGIDPLSRRTIWALLSELAKKKTALFVTTHYMEEAQRCDQLAFISNGRLLKVGTPDSYKEYAPNLDEAFAVLESKGLKDA